jgi:IrrE N-terminal-like domain
MPAFTVPDTETAETPPVTDDVDQGRNLLQSLLDGSRLYRSSRNYKALLEFVTRLRNIAPFNAMLLQIQKPGMQFAASADDWATLFNRTVKDSARPLLILWPFAPVALVYDVADTEGAPLPEDVLSPFRANGPITQQRLEGFAQRLFSKGIELSVVNYGTGLAGNIHSLEVGRASENRQEKPAYSIRINQNHDANTQFATLIHELAHLYLGHLGADTYLQVPPRPLPVHTQRELEAESVSYIVCKRNGVESAAEAYLSGYLKSRATIEDVDIFAILKAAGKIEAILDLACHTTFGTKAVK